jgi:hypothetical protein
MSDDVRGLELEQVAELKVKKDHGQVGKRKGETEEKE